MNEEMNNEEMYVYRVNCCMCDQLLLESEAIVLKNMRTGDVQYICSNKCQDLNDQEQKQIMKKIPCEVFSRIVGYYRKVDQWNPGKQEEFRERKTFSLDKFKQTTM